MTQEFRVSADGQIHAFPEDGLPENYIDEKYRAAARRQEKATAEEEAAKEEKKRATAIHKTKDRQLKWADVVQQIEYARVLSMRKPGYVFAAVDNLGELNVVRGKELEFYLLSESAFYAAFINGLEIPINEAVGQDSSDTEDVA